MRYLNVLHVRDSQRVGVQEILEDLKTHNILTKSTFPVAGRWYEKQGYAYHILYSLEPITIQIKGVSTFVLDQSTKHIFLNGANLSKLEFRSFMSQTTGLGFSLLERIEIWKGIALSLVPEEIELYSNVFVCEYDKFTQLTMDLKKMLVIGASEMKMTPQSYVVRIITVDSPILSIVKHIQVPLIIKDLSGKISLLRNNIEDGMDDLCWISDEVARDMAMYFISKPVI